MCLLAAPESFATPGMSEPRTPADFAEILAGEEPPLLVGGQAVNLWAEIYANQAPGLESFAPFTSADADTKKPRRFGPGRESCGE